MLPAKEYLNDLSSTLKDIDCFPGNKESVRKLLSIIFALRNVIIIFFSLRQFSPKSGKLTFSQIKIHFLVVISSLSLFFQTLVCLFLP
jgi:predicted membrane protein